MKARFLQGTVYSVGAMACSTAGVLAAGKLLTNTLTPAQVGQFALLLLCAEFMGTLANLGLPVTLPKLLQSHAGADRTRLLSSVFTLQLATALTLGFAGIVAAALGRQWLPLVAAWLPLPLPLLAVLPVLLIAVALRDFLLASTPGLHQYAHRAAAILLMAGLQVIFFAALFLGHADAPLPFAVSNLFAVTAGATLLARTVPRPAPADWGVAWAQVRFSAPLFANNLLNFIYQRADTLLVVYFLGIGTAAIFEMAKRIPGVVTRFFVAALVPYLPSVAELLHRGERARAGHVLRRASALAAYTGFGITLAAVAVQEPLLRLLFTADYAGATPVLGPLLIAACLAVQAGILGQVLIALERPRQVMYINAGMALLSVALNAVLLPRFGLAGAGWSAVAGALLSYVLQRQAVARAGIAVPGGQVMLIHALFIAGYVLLYWLGDLSLLAAGVVIVFATGGLAAGAAPLAEARALIEKVRP